MINLNMQGSRSYGSFLFYKEIENSDGDYRFKEIYRETVDLEKINSNNCLEILEKKFEIVKIIYQTIEEDDYVYKYLCLKTKDLIEGEYQTYYVEIVSNDSELSIETFAISEKSLKEVKKIYNSLFAEVKLVGSDNQVPINIWYASSEGATYYSRKIEVPSFEQIAHNYSSRVRKSIKNLLTLEKPWENGKLIFWMGPPGTGKTYCVRSLIQHWKETFTINLIIDPEAFLQNPNYLKEVVLSQPGSIPTKVGESGVEKATLIILEDCPRSVLNDARKNDSYNMARLLNVTDGILGQGLRIIFLMTTNDDIQDIDKAFIRDGRCLQRLKFDCLDIQSAKEWLEKQGYTGTFSSVEEVPLARLFAIKNNTFADAEMIKEEHVGFIKK